MRRWMSYAMNAPLTFLALGNLRQKHRTMKSVKSFKKKRGSQHIKTAKCQKFSQA